MKITFDISDDRKGYSYSYGTRSGTKTSFEEIPTPVLTLELAAILTEALLQVKRLSYIKSFHNIADTSGDLL